MIISRFRQSEEKRIGEITVKNKQNSEKKGFLSGIITLSKQIIRFVFSRYFITFLIIVLEVVLVEHLLYVISENFLITTAVVAVLYAIGFIHLINRDTNPEYKLTWLVVIAIPIAGVVLYFLFYDRRVSKTEAERLWNFTVNLDPSAEPWADIEERPESYGKIRALTSDDPLAVAYSNTKSRFFPSGESYFESLIADLSSAKKFIFLEYFIISEGELWSRIHEILLKKVGEGVDVRLLYDDIGCMQTLPATYERRLRKAGISAYRFGRVTPKLSSVHNNRDHRKIAVIDGRVGYTGGVNIADEYVNIKERFGHWKDGGIRIEGDAVRGLTRLFLSAYDFTSGEKSDYLSFMANDDTKELSDGGIYVPFGSGPSPIYKEKSGKNLLLNIINQANAYIWITTPYLIMDYELTEALCKASRRGVSVRIVTPGIADKKIIKIMTKSAYPYLKRSGVEIYEYLPGFIHEKTIISDDKYLVVGTVNLDYRSLMHHFEDGVFVIDSPVVDEAKKCYLETIKESDFRDNDEARLTPVEWAIRNLIRIFAPLL